MDETITLNDATRIDNAHCIESDGRLFVYIENTNGIKKYFDLFCDPDKTRRIVANRYGVETVYINYVDLYSISKEYGNVNLVLKK